MKINIAFLAPSEGIGGGNRKYKLYFDYLDKKYVNKYYIYLADKPFEEKKLSQDIYSIGEKRLVSFLKKKKIQFFYPGKKIKKEILNKIKSFSYILINVNFTPLYTTQEKTINLIISKTDYWKLKLIHKKLKNAHVVYNPIPIDKWLFYKKKVKPKYRDYFKDKKIKFIIGRIARAEPTKWTYLIIKTLLLLDKKKNYKYGFIFAGMPLLYRITLKVLLSKKMLTNILFLPEMKEMEKIAEFYKSIDLFWQTSKIGESFGNVIAEAFCFEVPVITDYKGFLKENGKINKKLYDAQIELVDHGINGFYANIPEVVIKFLEKIKKEQLKKMGKSGLKKVKSEYDVRNTDKTIIKILYEYLRKDKKIKKDVKFEQLKKKPSASEVKKFLKEYLIKQKEVKKINNRYLTDYFIQKKLWSFIELIYVYIRKILRYIAIDLESW